MSAANMNLRSWASNSAILQEAAAADSVIDKDDVIKVLGHRWKPSADTLTLTKREIPYLNKVTKRAILKYSSQIYDPLGLLSPVSIRAKLLMQELWKNKYEWDIFLPVDVQRTWQALACDLNKLSSLQLNRRFLQEQESSKNKEPTYLHIFVDASIQSYGAVAYICNSTESKIVMAKARVAPLKSLTLPQLELMAALIGARLATHLKNTMQMSNILLWSDSQIVLHWLSSNKPLKKFVANRVEEICKCTKPEQWRYCPTRDNPADLVTRGISANKFFESDLWITGPSWICNYVKWPTWEKTSVVLHTITDDQTIPQDQQTPSTRQRHVALHVENVIDFTRYSKYKKLLRVTANVMRFLFNCRTNQRKRTIGPINARELEQAEKKLIQMIQAEIFKNELDCLNVGQTNLPLIRQLRLFKDDDNIIRCGGRIHNAPVAADTKFPILLPRKHSLTKLIVSDAHEHCQHSGVNATVTTIRQKYWIPAIRQNVQSILRHCVVCRRVCGKPYTAPDSPPLPVIRVTEAPPFRITGVDFTGALYVRQLSGREEKVYICLFTCANTRAVHLEVVTSLSEEAFILALRRFVSRKSLPRIIVSDNATTFEAASNYLKRLFESKSVKETLCNMGIEWQFIPKRAPWYGGFWERLIALTKTAIKKTLGRSYVNLEMLQTIVMEAEAFMNDRPLTYVSSNADDPEPLTPAHLLYGRKLTSLPLNHDAVLSSNSSSSENILNRSKRLMHLIDQYWRRWKSEYLTSLREYHQKSGHNAQPVRVGEVVLIHDDGPRCSWKLAVIEELITGHDGMIRAAKIRTSNGRHTTRPVTKLFPLEVLSDTK